MEVRDRRISLALFAIAAAAWVAVGWVAASLDPRGDPGVGFVGATVLGLAAAFSAAPIAWLLVFARHRRIAYRGDWGRALRRGAWIGVLVAVFVLLRLNGIFQPQIALFLAAMALVAEVTLTTQR
jgi:hypothetical protein